MPEIRSVLDVRPVLDAGSLLTQLIDWGDRVLHRGAWLSAEFEALAENVTERAKPGPARDMPCEAAMLVTALRNAAEERNNDQSEMAQPWGILAEVLLRLTQAAAARTIAARRNTIARPDPDAQPNYRSPLGGHSR